jgi:hypothetical protein
LACTAHKYQNGRYQNHTSISQYTDADLNLNSFVFGGFINTTGWNDGAAWLLGMLQGAFTLVAYDA